MDSQVKRDADEDHLIVTDPASVPPPPPSDEDVVTSAPLLPTRSPDVSTTVSSPIVEVASRIISHLMCETHHEASKAALLPLEVQQIPVENGNKMNAETPSSTFQQEVPMPGDIAQSDIATTTNSAKELVSLPNNPRQPETNEKVNDPAVAAQLKQLEEAISKINDPAVAAQLKAQGEKIIAAQVVADDRWKIIEYTIIGGAIVVTLAAVSYGGYRLYKKLTIS